MFIKFKLSRLFKWHLSQNGHPRDTRALLIVKVVRLPQSEIHQFSFSAAQVEYFLSKFFSSVFFMSDLKLSLPVFGFARGVSYFSIPTFTVGVSLPARRFFSCDPRFVSTDYVWELLPGDERGKGEKGTQLEFLIKLFDTMQHPASWKFSISVFLILCWIFFFS